jgi:predicted acylesterase/phospholipase RssA
MSFHLPRIHGRTPSGKIDKHPQRDIDVRVGIHEPYDAIVLSSGGARGIAQFGALNLLYTQYPEAVENARYFIGSSAGAVLATLLAMGITPHDAFVGYVVPFKYRRSIRLDMLGTLFGIETSGSLDSFLAGVVDRDVTFRDVYEEHGTVLSIIGTNISKATSVIFDAVRTPDMSVFEALRISCSVPILFPAVRVDGEYFVDGAVSDPFPVGVAMDVYGCRHILGLRFDHFAASLSAEGGWKLDDYIGAVIDTMIHSSSMNVPARRGVITDVVTIVTPDDISGIDFSLSTRKKYELFDAGAESMLSYLKKNN